MQQEKVNLSDILEKIIAMVKSQGWGVDGIQDPQHLVQAMAVEMGELLEHFAWAEKKDILAIQNGEKPEKAKAIGEEFADVVIYGLQLMNALGLDSEKAILDKIDVVAKRKYPKSDD